MPDSLIALDQQLLLWFNGSDSLFLDHFVMLLTNGLTWVPLYLALFYLVVKNNEKMSQIFLIISCALCCYLLSGGINDAIIKPFVARWRPTEDPIFKYAVSVVAGYRGGSDYGFFSSHSANTMAIAVFFSLLVRNRLLNTTLVLWAILNGWTRLYLGVHYPSDVLSGWLWGAMVGTLAYFAFYKFYYKISPKINYISSQYTKTGYSTIDIDVVMLVLMTILTVAVMASLSVF